jgi:hypothetical protein
MRTVIERCWARPGTGPRLPAFDGLDADTAAEVLEQAARFASEVLATDQRRRRPPAARWATAGDHARAALPAYRPSSTAAGRRWPARPSSAARACRSC